MANYLTTSATAPTTANTNLRLVDELMIGADADPAVALHVTG